MTDTALNIACNIRCPECARKLCKIRDYPFGAMVELKHKRAFVLAAEAIIGCVDCKKTFKVTAESKFIEEVNCGR